MAVGRVIDLSSGPVELRALIGGGGWFVQNTGTTKVYYGQRATAPATTDDGVCLSPGAGLTIGIDLTVEDSPPGVYVWARGAGKVAVERASALG